MQPKRDELVPIGEALADLPGPVQALREASPQALQGAKRRSEPLTARTDLESSRARGKGVVGCRRDWTNGLLALVNQAARHFRNIFAAAILALRP